jgi:hypothetical protein
MLPPVQSIIEAIPLTAVGDRVFQTTAEQGKTKDAQGNQLDYIVWLMVSQNPNNTLSDRPEDDAQRVQIDYYGKNPATARNNMVTIRDHIEGVGYVIDGPVPEYEPETLLYRYRMDVAFITSRDYDTID